MTQPGPAGQILLGIAACMLIFSAVLSFPLLGVFALLFLPLPVLYFRLKLGRPGGIIIACVSFVLMMALTRAMAFDVLYFGALLTTGLFLGECIEKHLGIERTIVFTTVGVIGAGFLAFAFYTLLKGQSMGQVLNEYLGRYFALTNELYTQMGFEKDQVQLLNDAFIAVLPGMFLVSYVSTAWLNILIIKKMLLKNGIVIQSIENLNRYRAPAPLVWLVIAFGFGLFLPAEGLRYLSVNCLILLMLVYFFQGIAVVSYFFEQKKSPAAVRVLCYSLIAVQIYVLILVIGLGFFDNWINFRKLSTAKE